MKNRLFIDRPAWILGVPQVPFECKYSNYSALYTRFNKKYILKLNLAH